MEGVQLCTSTYLIHHLETDMLDTLDSSIRMCQAGPLWMANGKGSASSNALLEEPRNAPQLWSDMDAPFQLLPQGAS